MNFGEALQALKEGSHVARTGWNGKGMHVYLEGAHDIPIRGGVYKGQVRRVEPVLCMYTATGTHQPGWLASQADMLADDWLVVGP